MDKAKRIYETTCIVNASLDDSQVEAVIGRVVDTITKNGGTITSLNKWGRKRLSYSINKKTNGFYVNIEFEAPATLIALLERSYQLDEMILRYLTIMLDAKALAARAAIAAAAPAASEEPAPPPPAREPLFKETGSEEKN
ncbi:MAG: 30S ribosomal protein S6 [Ignavibacteriae bacterium]|nr:30S ribosomal protein S6 [Ignavibacteriota bacterium]